MTIRNTVQSTEIVEIMQSKTKLMLLMLGMLAFIAIGTLFILTPETFALRFKRVGPQLIRIVGITGVIVFTPCFVIFVIRLFNKKVGLIMSPNGILDQSSNLDIGLIEWDDITEIGTVKIVSNKFIVLHTNQPEKYINRVTNRFTRQGLTSNYKSCGSPLLINSITLNIKHKQLEQLLVEQFEKNKMT